MESLGWDNKIHFVLKSYKDNFSIQISCENQLPYQSHDLSSGIEIIDNPLVLTALAHTIFIRVFILGASIIPILTENLQRLIRFICVGLTMTKTMFLNFEN